LIAIAFQAADTSHYFQPSAFIIFDADEDIARLFAFHMRPRRRSCAQIFRCFTPLTPFLLPLFSDICRRRHYC
jgi:hypothetical protein